MKSKNNSQPLTINITGTFTTELIKKGLDFWFEKANIATEINFVGYNQVFQQLINPSSDFNAQQNQINCILIRLEDILLNDNINASSSYNDLKDTIISNLNISANNKLLVVFCPPSDIFFKSHKKLDESYLFEVELEKLTESFSNLIVVKSSVFSSSYSLSNYYEPLGETNGNIPYKSNFFAAAATLIARKVHALRFAPLKAIVVDCDNTIWQGVVGEDGPQNVKVGKAERDLQEFLIAQNNQGVLICLCSKNVEKDVWDAFDQNSEMILKRDHIGFFKINWEPKSKNLIDLAREINIGLDSMVFIDDNPVECEEVKVNASSVVTIQKRIDIDSISYIKNSWLFDRIKVTDEDKKRATMYKMEANRSILKTQIKSYGEFLKELNIHIHIQPVTKNDIPRISQLTYRTNQFNFTTIRRSEDEINQLLTNPSNGLYLASLNDKFGEYGIIGAFITTIKDNDLIVDTFLLSCRALGKGVEHKMLAFIGELAKQNNNSNVVIPFLKTEKNIVAENFILKNFADFSTFSNNESIYTIPTQFAVSFRFDPENNVFHSPEDTVEATISVSENIIERNMFFDDIVKNLYDIQAITNAIYKKTSVRKIEKTISLSNFEDSLLTIWQDVLDNPNIGVNDNFFDIGGESLLIPQIVIRLHHELNTNIKIVDIFQYPTVKALAAFINAEKLDSKLVSATELSNIKKQKDQLSGNGSGSSNKIAIIGMSGRFPGAQNIDEYWQIISQGKETISHFTRDELKAKGVPDVLLDNPDYIYANGIVDGGDEFDAAFFGFTPLEANCMDPQHRIFLETSYEALENAGYVSENFEGSIGVFAGSGPDNYQFKNLSRQPETLKKLGELQIVTNNGKDYLTTYVSYKLDLKGPSMNIQTACSTSLVAVHMACLNLLTYQCDIALAGGAFIQVPRGKGYMYKQGEIFSRIGQCRPFDKDADGMLFGEGAGVVVLKRYEDALKDNDTIWAVIKGTAINNDGSLKVGYMAPSVEGQSNAIARAQAFAGVDPNDISYLETHGTGTHIGDPIEITALKKAFELKTDQKNYCAIGSVKANIGHLDAAAGVAGLIKTVLALKHQQIPPSINFNEPNPELQIEDSPFFVNTKLTNWETHGKTRIAGVSSFGVGGTNAHCIVEEVVSIGSPVTNKHYHPIVLSAKTKNALKHQQSNLKQFLIKNKTDISDTAYTLLVGRKKYKYRSAFFSHNIEETLKKLDTPSEGIQTLEEPILAFVFTGQGSQYQQMAKDLYHEFPVFKKVVDEAHSYLNKNYGIDILNIIYSENNSNQINNTEFAQPVLFVIQYALCKLLESFGVKPSVLTGHSIGEITAACITGLFSFNDALKIVAVRGKLMQAQKTGSMLSVQLSAADVKKILPENVDLALINAPNVTVVSGEYKDIEDFQKLIKDKFPEIPTSILATSHAFHSRMMDPAVEEFKHELSDIKFGTINIPFISNVTGTWADQQTVGSIEYWANHIRSTVNFVDGINVLLKEKNTLFIEVGPGTSISSLLSQYNIDKRKLVAVSTMRHPKKENNDLNVFFDALSQIWINGADAAFDNYYNDEIRSRIPLPTYPFERKKHWIEPKNALDFNLEHELISDIQNAETTDVEESQQIDDSYFDRPELGNAYLAPENEVQKQIIAIWQELLGIKNIGINDDFFDLGGHSLLASQIINRINDHFKVKLPIEIIFKHSKVIELDTVLASHTYSGQSNVVFQKIEGNANLPVSHEQIRLWILSQFDKNPAYNIPFTYKFTGKINESLFVKALQDVISRNAILRGNIKTVEIEPTLFINTSKLYNIHLLDFSADEPQLRSEKVNNQLKEIVQKVFDIENDPLYRIYLFKCSDSEIIFHMTINHLVFDGWSWGIFLKELYQIYTNLVLNTPVTLSLPEYQYHEYAAWQKIQMTDSFYQKSLKYWSEKLKGHPTQINLPHDFKRKPKNSGLGGRVFFTLPNQLNQKLKALSKKHGVTEFTTYISAFALLLNKYGGDTDICIGIPAANRPNATLEKIIGFFVNTLVLRFGVDTEATFTNFLAQNKKVVLEALEHQDLPFDRLVNALQPPRIVNINPVFQTMFSWLSAPRLPHDITQFKTERFPISEGISPLDITVYITEDEGLIEGEVEFSADIFSRETIARLTENYLCLLNNLAENPDASLDKFDCVSNFEKETIDNFNKTHTPVANRFVHEMLEKQVIESGNKTALYCNNESLTYTQLNSMANKISNYLISRGVRENDVVGISLNRSALMLASVLGILKSGAAYLPLDPSFPNDRLSYMLGDSSAKLLITETLLESNIETIVEKIILDNINIQEEINNQTTTKPNIQITPDSLAYLIYTSGSTGMPKGVKVHHGAVTNFIESMATVPGFSSNDTLLAVTTLSFDISVLEIFLPLYKGGCIVLAQKMEVINGSALMKLMEKYSVTVLQATPATWNILNHSGWKGNPNLKALCGGEAISVNLIKDLLPKVSELWNMYGPTETTVWSTCGQLTSEEPPVLVGMPINNTSVYIISANNTILPIGCSGEVCIGGLGVTKGYHNRPELTAEKFITLPSGEVIYKTGDVGKYRYDGQIELFGRIDNQIKLRGFRIEPGEIEVQICKSDGVQEAVVKVQKFSELDERLVAFLNVSDAFKMSAESITQQLKAHLPEYMIPVHFKIMNSFPRTPNGKINKKDLMIEDTDIIQTQNEVVQKPTSEKELERSILDIWKNTIRKQNITVNDNFFDVGGNSLLLIQVANSVNKLIGKEIEIMYFFEYSTVKALSTYIVNNIQITIESEITVESRSNRFQQVADRRKRN